jgi:hypothetical protein
MSPRCSSPEIGLNHDWHQYCPFVQELPHLARLWHRRETLLGFVAAVKEGMKDARPELIPTAQAWVAWIEAHLEEYNPADVLFFEPLLTRDSPGFHRWSVGGRERDEWLEEWADAASADDDESLEDLW